MTVRFRLPFKRTLLLLAGLATFYLAFGYWLLPPLLRWAAESYVEKELSHRLSLGQVEFDPLELSLRLANLRLSEPDGKPLLAFRELNVDFAGMASLTERAWVLEDIRLDAPGVTLEMRADGSLNFTRLIEALNKDKEEEDQPPPRLLLRRIVLQGGTLDFADRKVSPFFTARLDPIELTLTGLSTLAGLKGAYQFDIQSVSGARLNGKGDLQLQPPAVNGAFSLDGFQLARLSPYLASHLKIAPPEGRLALGGDYRVALAEQRLSLALEGLGLQLEGLKLRGAAEKEPSLALDRLRLEGGRFDLEGRSLAFTALTLEDGRVDLARSAAGRLNIEDWFVPAKPAEPEPAPATEPGAAPQPWKIGLDRLDLDGIGLRYRDAGFAKPLTAEIDKLRLGLKASAEVGGARTEALVEGLGLDLSGVRLAAAGEKQPLFVLDGLSVQEGSIDLSKQTASLKRVTLNQGRLAAVRNASGDIELLRALQPRPMSRKAAAKTKKATPAPAWHWQVGEVALAGFEIGLRDEGVQPATRLDLQRIEASVRGLSDRLGAALPVRLDLRVKQGGRFSANGKVVPAPPSADLRLSLDDLALAPAQPYLTQAANLNLASGRLSSAGRFQYGKSLDYKGNFALRDLLLNETQTGERFLAWRSLTSEDLAATPESVEIGTLRVDGLGAKLIIYEDKSVNLKKILKQAEPASPEQTAPPREKPRGGEERAFRLALDHVLVSDGELDFADLSLALPFGTRIHQFKGSLNGIYSEQGGRPSQLELDGLVDEYGLARAVGQLNLFDPTGFMDIKVDFRNVEMANLTPYSATFAGRKINSGKLSLALEYRIKDRQLQGENQIIMDRLTLGERVESPTAKDLPLDLAIAILEDSDGRIDLGLPVSGSLDDPQFSYGSLIWKAIGNVLTKIVTAPFRALASLFGGGAEKMESVAFDPGSARLLPPEREKLKQLAQALAKRPKLGLTVQAGYDPEADRARLKEAALQRAITLGMGLKLATDEEAPPLSTVNPKARLAIEALYGERLSKEALAQLQARHLQANPEQQQGPGKMKSRLDGPTPKEEAPPPEELEALKGTDLHDVMYRKLLEAEKVPDATLVELGRARGEAIVRELADTLGVPRERLSQEVPQATAGDAKGVKLKLTLGVIRAPAAAPTPAPQAPPAAGG